MTNPTEMSNHWKVGPHLLKAPTSGAPMIELEDADKEGATWSFPPLNNHKGQVHVHITWGGGKNLVRAGSRSVGPMLSCGSLYTSNYARPYLILTQIIQYY